jgi:hypothetical protein
MDEGLGKLRSAWGQADNGRARSRANFRADWEGHHHDTRRHAGGMRKGAKSR